MDDIFELSSRTDIWLTDDFQRLDASVENLSIKTHPKVRDLLGIEGGEYSVFEFTDAFAKIYFDTNWKDLSKIRNI